MKMTEVESSLISAVGYATDLLIVRFGTGSVYAYDGVPLKKYLELLEAVSIGKYFLANIRDNYTATKLSE